MAPSATRNHEPPTFYAWDVRDGETGSAGVTNDRDIAIGRVHHAIRTGASGARGKVRHVALAPSGGAKYVDLATVGEAWLDETSGAVVWEG